MKKILPILSLMAIVIISISAVDSTADFDTESVGLESEAPYNTRIITRSSIASQPLMPIIALIKKHRKQTFYLYVQSERTSYALYLTPEDKILWTTQVLNCPSSQCPSNSSDFNDKEAVLLAKMYDQSAQLFYRKSAWWRCSEKDICFPDLIPIPTAQNNPTNGQV